MDKKEKPTLAEMAEVLKPFELHDLEDVCQRIEMDLLGPVQPATIMALAVEKCMEPVGGEDSFGDLTWRVGPHRHGLPYVLVEMEYDHERTAFTTRLPLTPEQIQTDFDMAQQGEEGNAIVADYLDEQLDEDDRKSVWSYLAEDAQESVRSQEGAQRIRENPELPQMLLDAVQAFQRRAVHDLLDLGANPNCTDTLGNTPLHIAAREGHHQLILPLLHAGAWVDEVNHQGQSPLHLAAARACGHGCLVLLAHNADPKRRDHRGRTPIPQPFEGYRYHEPEPEQ